MIVANFGFVGLCFCLNGLAPSFNGIVFLNSVPFTSLEIIISQYVLFFSDEGFNFSSFFDRIISFQSRLDLVFPLIQY
jgi:hypothetical protein